MVVLDQQIFNMNKTYVLGDLHGRYDKLINVLKLANFDYETDTLISLGDIVDRGPDSYLCIEELLKIKNLIAIQGNHDECWFRSLKSGQISDGLLWKQGAINTYQSYLDAGINPEIHFDFFNNQIKYHIDSEKRYFVHGGFNRHYPIDQQMDPTVFTWDRDLWGQVLSYKNMNEEAKKYPFKIYGKPKEIFIGHTPTLYWNNPQPMQAENIWNIDTGCGKSKEALLTIMEVETKQFYQA